MTQGADEYLRPWASWGRAEWNDALVDAVFTLAPGASPVLTRVDATSRFLAKVVREEAKNAERVRKKFISCFAGSARDVRHLFDFDLQTSGWSVKSQSLPFFAQLYLSLLVASADEETRLIGNFRERLIAILHLPTTASFTLEGLPLLWCEAERWSHQSDRKRLRRLRLPHPGSERIIGHAKRLSFPVYRDQTRLAQVMTAYELDVRSTVASVISGVSAERARFTDQFNEEFRKFTEYFDSGDRRAALNSPFWGAIQDISWEVAPKKAKEVTQNFLLELDVIDSYAPQLLLFGRQSVSPRFKPWSSTPRSHISGQYRFEIQMEGQEDSRLLECIVAAASRSMFAGSRLRREIENGCLVFSTDYHGRLVSAPSLELDNPFWLVLEKSKWVRTCESLKRAGLLPDICLTFPHAARWGLLGEFLLTDRLRDTLLGELGEEEWFGLRLRAPQIRLSGGYMLPEGLLFLPRALPSLVLDGCTMMTWSARIGGVAIVQERPLLRTAGTEEPSFHFSSTDPDELSGAATIQITAFDAQGMILDRKELQTVPARRSWDVKQPRDMRRWLEPGTCGQLVSAFDASTARPAPPNTNELALFPLVPSASRAPEVLHQPYDAMSPIWQVALEVLSAAFSRSAAIPTSEFFELVQRLWKLCAAEVWPRIQDLVDNGFVRHVMSRHWHGGAFVARPPCIEATEIGDEWMGRVVGVVPHLLRREIAYAVARDHATCSVFVSPGRHAVGSLQFRVPTHAALELAASKVKIPVCVREEPSVLASWGQLFATAPEAPRGELAVWSDAKKSFIQDATQTGATCQLERWRSDGSQDLFVLRSDNRVWTTRSRAWALLGFHAAAVGQIGFVDSNGSITLASPELNLPPAVALAVLRRGGGICFTDELGRRVYPGGPGWSPVTMLRSWVEDHKETTSPLGRASAQLGLAFTHRVGSASANALRRHWQNRLRRN